ncbi:Hsp20/alpha crystallin family protein [Oscillatoria sp. FACHB-1407]|uniref:Hsp20/alpha crystallin family protein n=1 Tax=Oscillatoria sp. FACHB-1407 TaxID=2692847 RepID=UPI001683F361|nr:Hsp20/alpha crystallin family protein [Oscillatoria sp. FACHB-1407]MBD2461625.1 Hsp20/alpha crystallin family protein [Oscillatoria sp. FACHB-1407]
MLVRYWQPLREMEMMRRQFDSLFNELAPATQTQPTWAPAIELKDAGDNVTLRAQLPGIDAKDLDIQVSKKAVSISGEQRHESKTDENGVIRSEFRYGKFQRVIPLPVAVQNDQVQAEYKDGVLNLTLPKVAEARNSVVKISLTNDTPAIADGQAA